MILDSYHQYSAQYTESRLAFLLPCKEGMKQLNWTVVTRDSFFVSALALVCATACDLPIVEPHDGCDEVPDAGAVDSTPEDPECIEAPDGLVGWWTGDQDATDIRGGNHGQLLGSAVAGSPGLVVGAFEFDGIDDYVEIADDDALDFGVGDFSVDMWVKTDDDSGVKVLLDKRSEPATGDVQGYSAYIIGGVLGFQLADGNGTSLCSTAPTSSCTNFDSSTFIADGEWHFIAVTVDRDSTTGLKFYVDGALVASADATLRANSLDNGHPLRIGSRSSTEAGLLQGSIDEIELFNRILTDEEVLALYNAGSGGKCKISSPCGTPQETSTCQVDLNDGSVACSAGNPMTLVNTSAGFVYQLDMTDWSSVTADIEVVAPTGWVLHLGNSSGNDGNGGDDGSTSNDSEMQLLDTTVSVFYSDRGGSGLAHSIPDAVIGGSASMVVCDGYLEWNNNGTANQISDDYIFQIDGDEPDTSAGGVNDTSLWLGLERTAASSARSGDGLASITLQFGR